MRLLVFVLMLFTYISLPEIVLAEQIKSFDVEYKINSDASIQVTETIVYDFETEWRHGIFRTLKTNHTDESTVWYKDREVEIYDIKVLQDGLPANFEKSGNDVLLIKVGDADETITGAHVYTLIYSLKGALSYNEGVNQEFYWNVTGSEWPVSMNEVKVGVISEAEITASSCYVGALGSTDLCEGESTNMFSFSGLAAGNDMTIAVGFKEGSFPIVRVETINYEPMLLLVFLIALFVTLVSSWRYQRYYHRARPLIAEYEPYSGVEPMMSGVLIDDNLDAKDISAGIVYLAEQGFISIKKTEKKVVWLFNVTDYELTLRRDVSAVSSAFLGKILSLFFPANVSVGTVVALSSIKGDATKKLENQKMLVELNEAIRKDLTKAGFFEDRSVSVSKLLWPFAMVILVAVFAASNIFPVSIALFVGGLGILWFVFALSRIRRRTARGYEAAYHLKGFKQFLSVTDKERFDFHNAPERSPEQFMKYLPFAIAFGVEEKWAELFSDMEISNPSWYEGNAASGAFIASDFTNDINSFTSAVTTSTTTASSGGGSAGGGGGGGGGGSW